MTRTIPEQLVHFLSDMYSVEEQALAQLVSAPKLAGDPGLAEIFRQHYEETKNQAESVRRQLEIHDGSPSVVKDAIMKLGGKGFLLFARVQPETPGKLVVHAYAYEAMEWAGYEMLERFARQAGDLETVETAQTIGREERQMMQRLETHFNNAERASHENTPLPELCGHVRKHLEDVHAFESQGVQLLGKSESIAGSATLSATYAQILAMHRRHAEQVEQRLETLGSDPSTLKSGALALGGINWGLFFQAQSDTAAKLAAFVYAFLHLEIGGYELLKRTAQRAGDGVTERLCEVLLGEKRTLADGLAQQFDAAVRATLEQVAE